MATKTDDAPHPGVYDLRESMKRAQKALNRYEHERLAAAAQGTHPEESSAVQQRHLDLHTALMDVYRQLRGHIARELPEYWGGTRTDDDGPLLFEYPDGSVIQGLKDLDDFQGQVSINEGEVRKRHGGVDRVVKADPYLVPVQAARRAINYMGECMVELEFAAQPSERTVIHEVPKDGNVE